MATGIRVFAINPGSTSTKTALFEDDVKLAEISVAHDAATLSKPVPEQLTDRADFIRQAVEAQGLTLEGVAAFAGRGGGSVSCHSGVYAVNDRMLQDARVGVGAMHPSSLGSQLADAFARELGAQAFIVNPVNVDELILPARLTGIRGIYRACHLHALNQKEVALRHAAALGRRYEDINLVIAHIGGGITVTAHQRGRMIDSSDGIEGDGPMAPTRAGSVPSGPLVSLCLSGELSPQQLLSRFTSTGGWMDHLHTSDAREVMRRVDQGDQYAALMVEATIHQIVKHIGAYAAALSGDVDGVLLTGGLAHQARITDEIKKRVAFIAPVYVYPGEFELEALAAGALRVLRGQEQARTYTGLPVWDPASLAELKACPE